MAEVLTIESGRQDGQDAWVNRDQESRALEASWLSKGMFPPDVKAGNTNISFHIHKFPHGGIENFSVARAAVAIAKVAHEGHEAWRHYAPWEFAYYRALQDARWVDQSIGKAAGDQVSGQDGAYLAPEFWSSEWFDLLRSISVLDRLPIARRNVPYRQSHFATVTGDVTITYPGENSAPTATQYKFGQITYSPRKAIIVYNISVELVMDSAGEADDVLRRSTARAFAVDRDNQAMTSNGSSNAPTGLAYNPLVPGANGNGSNGATNYKPAADAGNGATPAYADFIAFINQIEQLSSVSTVTAGQVICNGMVGNVRVNNTVHAILDSQNRPVWPLALEQDGGFLGVKYWPLAGSTIVPVNITKGTSNDTSYLIGGAWENFLLQETKTLGYDATQDGQGFASNQVQVRVVHRWDAGPLHPEAFGVMTGVRG